MPVCGCLLYLFGFVCALLDIFGFVCACLGLFFVLGLGRLCLFMIACLVCLSLYVIVCIFCGNRVSKCQFLLDLFLYCVLLLNFFFLSSTFFSFVLVKCLCTGFFSRENVINACL